MVLKTCILGRGFHTLIRNALFPSPIDVGSHRIGILYFISFYNYLWGEMFMSINSLIFMFILNHLDFVTIS